MPKEGKLTRDLRRDRTRQDAVSPTFKAFQALSAPFTALFSKKHATKFAHQSLEKDTPVVRAIQSKPKGGKLIALPRVSGLHHRYLWKKAA